MKFLISYVSKFYYITHLLLCGTTPQETHCFQLDIVYFITQKIKIFLIFAIKNCQFLGNFFVLIFSYILL